MIFSFFQMLLADSLGRCWVSPSSSWTPPSQEDLPDHMWAGYEYHHQCLCSNILEILPRKRCLQDPHHSQCSPHWQCFHSHHLVPLPVLLQHWIRSSEEHIIVWTLHPDRTGTGAPLFFLLIYSRNKKISWFGNNSSKTCLFLFVFSPSSPPGTCGRPGPPDLLAVQFPGHKVVPPAGPVLGPGHPLPGHLLHLSGQPGFHCNCCYRN